MDQATITAYALETAEQFQVGTSPIAVTPEEAICVWAEDESIENLDDLGEVLGLTDEGDAIQCSVRALVRVSKPGPDRWSEVADRAVSDVVDLWSAEYGTGNDSDGHAFTRYYAVRTAIRKALDELTANVEPLAYRCVATREYTREQVESILRKGGVW